MNYRIIILGWIVYLLFSDFLIAQTSQAIESGSLYKTNQSVLFGSDIIINNIPTEDQRNVAICSAYNGWLYSCYWRPDNSGYSYYIMRSTDSGMSWTELFTVHYQSSSEKVITKMDIVACGNNSSNLKVFLGMVITYLPTYQGQGVVLRFNGFTGDYEDEILKDQDSYVHDLALSNDFMYPATNSNPNSVAVLYSKGSPFFSYEKLVFCSSSNEGISFDHVQEIITSATRHFFHVDLTYGRCPSKNTGRYFATWEDKSSLLDSSGHIYTAHTEPFFDSPMTSPVCLDSLDQSAINVCHRPVIACQFDDIDNDSANLTQLVLFEKFEKETNSYKIKGYYNKQSTSTSHFNEFIFNNSTHINVQSDIAYNPFDNTFMLTYFDSTTKKLPLLTNNLNMTDPNNWDVVTSGYNDNSNIGAPFPMIKLNPWQNSSVNVWISDGSGNNGIAMFDAPYGIYPGFSERNEMKCTRHFKAYPIPCDSYFTIAFLAEKEKQIQITLCNQLGQPIMKFADNVFPAGNHRIKADVSKLPAGNYFLLFNNGNFFESGKIIIIR
ncbi:MAG: T9SS type A sorting domain-containing protein [Bacteroidales bacterium]|nr:T9SS type A sorting domain-containing protein [Bacteroidales bacterium]